MDTGEKDDEGNAILAAKYGGIHALRHFYASWCINRREDGGLGLPPKVVQERLGHGDINITMNIYSHVTETMQRDAVERLTALFAGV